MNTLSKTDGVQQVRCKYFDLTLADFVSNSNVIDVALPANAIVTGGFATVNTVANGTGTDVLDIGDSGTANRYKNDVDLETLGLTALVPTGYRVTGAETSSLRLTRTAGGTNATTLDVSICVQYVVRGVSEANQD
jgi:hypothetical protein